MSSLEKDLNFLLRRLESAGASVCLYGIASGEKPGTPLLPPGMGYHDNPLCLEVKKSAERHRRCMQYENGKICRAFESRRLGWDLCPFGVLDAVIPIPAENPQFVLFISDGRRLHGTRRSDLKARTLAPEASEQGRELAAQAQSIHAAVEALLFHRRGEWLPAAGGSLMGKKAALARHNVLFYFNGPISLASLARQLSVSKPLLARYYKKIWKRTLHDDLNHRRVQHARGLLERGTPVTETAHECGYNDAGYFCRVFKKITGKNPRDWQKKR